VGRVSDFTFYWIAAQRFFAGTNPYAADPAHGWIMLAPPWILPLLWPLGALSLSSAETLWFALSVAALLLSLLWLWQIYGQGARPLWAALLAGTFAPVIVELLMGQMSLVMLLGVAGFLRYQRTRPLRAGSFLFLLALKPQIGFLVWPALLLCAWQLGRTEWLVGFSATLATITLFASAMRPGVFLEYWTAYHTHHRDFYQTASLGSLVGSLWVLPIGALAWFAWRWKTTSGWAWRAQMPALLLMSLVASPHVWFADQVLLLPALFHAFGLARRSYWLAAGYFLLNAMLLVSLFVAHQAFWYPWIILVWVSFYTLVVGICRAEDPNRSAAW